MSVLLVASFVVSLHGLNYADIQPHPHTSVLLRMQLDAAGAGKDSLHQPMYVHPEQELHGFYLTMSSHVAEQLRINATISAEAEVTVKPFIALDDPADDHLDRVAKAHIGMLEACYATDAAKPCLILEDDAQWPAGKLGQAVAQIYSEQGVVWDLAMLSMSNRELIRRHVDHQVLQKDMSKHLQVDNLQAHTMRVAKTLNSCAGYVVNSHASLLKVMQLMRDRLAKRGFPCTESISAVDAEAHNITIVTLRRPIVVQGPEKADRFAWHV